MEWKIQVIRAKEAAARIKKIRETIPGFNPAQTTMISLTWGERERMILKLMDGLELTREEVERFRKISKDAPYEVYDEAGPFDSFDPKKRVKEKQKAMKRTVSRYMKEDARAVKRHFKKFPEDKVLIKAVGRMLSAQLALAPPPGPEGGLTALPDEDTRSGRSKYLEPTQKRSTDDPLHWSKRLNPDGSVKELTDELRKAIADVDNAIETLDDIEARKHARALSRATVKSASVKLSRKPSVMQRFSGWLKGLGRRANSVLSVSNPLLCKEECARIVLGAGMSRSSYSRCMIYCLSGAGNGRDWYREQLSQPQGYEYGEIYESVDKISQIDPRYTRKVIQEETLKLFSEMRSWNDDRRYFIERSDLAPEEQTDEELHQQFTEVCRGDVVDQYCKDVHAEIESREQDIMHGTSSMLSERLKRALGGKKFK